MDGIHSPVGRKIELKRLESRKVMLSPVPARAFATLPDKSYQYVPESLVIVSDYQLAVHASVVNFQLQPRRQQGETRRQVLRKTSPFCSTTLCGPVSPQPSAL